jgi:hypothetical protein
MATSVLTTTLHEKAHKLGDEYYQSMVRWVRDRKVGMSGPAANEHLQALKRSADAYLSALEEFKQHLETLKPTPSVLTQLELTGRFIEMIEKNEGTYNQNNSPGKQDGSNGSIETITPDDLRRAGLIWSS